MLEKINKSAFSIGKLPEYIAFFKWMEKEELTINDIEFFHVENIKRVKETLKIPDLNQCPECKKNTYTGRPLKNNIKGFTKHLFCVNDECCFEEYL